MSEEFKVTQTKFYITYKGVDYTRLGEFSWWTAAGINQVDAKLNQTLEYLLDELLEKKNNLSMDLEKASKELLSISENLRGWRKMMDIFDKTKGVIKTIAVRKKVDDIIPRLIKIHDLLESCK